MVSTYRPTIGEVKGDQDWSALEQDLLDECTLGREAYLPGKEDVPEECSDPERRVRAELVRYLLLGGCGEEGGARPHPMGVHLRGGWIDGALSFQGCETPLDLSLHHCLLPQRPTFRDAHLGGLYLAGSRCKAGLDLHRLETETNVHLNKGFHCTGHVGLGGGKLGGQLVCAGGRFDGAGGVALNGDAMTVGADVALCDGFVATGMVILRGAKLGGSLNCSSGRFDGTAGVALEADALTVGGSVYLHDGFAATGVVNLGGAKVGGQLVCAGGRFDGAGGVALNCNTLTVGADMYFLSSNAKDGQQASPCHLTGVVDLRRARIDGDLEFSGVRFDGALHMDSVRVNEGFIWQAIDGEVPVLNLTEAKVGVLRDDAASWKAVEFLVLSGFSYESVQSPMGIAERLAWLMRKAERGLPKEMIGHLQAQPWLTAARSDFDPQPYTQLAKVLDAQGNRGGAARVLEVRETKVRAAAQRRALGRVDGEWRSGFASLPAAGLAVWDLLFRWLFGYGHKPGRALIWVFGIWLFGLWLYGNAYAAGQMAPNSDVIVSSPHWIAAVETADACGGCVQPLTEWLDSPDAQDYETFSAGLYALDLFVPLDALGQESTWAPSKVRGGWGRLGYWARMPIQLMGWIITAVGAAVLTGLVGRKD